MHNRKTTIRDIAERLSITPSTVSRALNGNSRISEATRSAVQKVAAEMNYRPNTVAASLRRGKTKIIGVVLPTLQRNFFASVVMGIETVVKEAGYNVMLTQCNEDPELERSNLEALMRAQVDGVIVSVSRRMEDFSIYQKFKERGVPLILFDRVTDQVETSEVVIDDFRGGYEATHHLIEQGCRDIVHLCGETRINIYRNRAAGFQQALTDNGITFDPDRHLIKTDQSVEEGKRAGRDMLRWDRLPDGIFSASDWGAVGVMAELKAAGVKVPEQVAVVGFANEPFVSFLDPPLSSVDQMSEEIGRSAARTFLDRVDEAAGTPVRRTVLQPKLIIRKSSMRNAV